MEKKASKREIDNLELIKHELSNATMHSHNINGEIKDQPEKNKKNDPSESTFELFEIGYNILLKEIELKAKQGEYAAEEEVKPLPIESFRISPQAMEAIKSKLSEQSNEKKTYYTDVGYTTDILFIFYGIAVRFCEEARYQDSIHAFQFLTILNPFIQAFWIGLAIGYEKDQNYPKAIEMYEEAIKSNPANFSPFYGLIRCCEEIKDFSKCRHLLEEQKMNESIKTEIEEAELYILSKK